MIANTDHLRYWVGREREAVQTKKIPNSPQVPNTSPLVGIQLASDNPLPHTSAPSQWLLVHSGPSIRPLQVATSSTRRVAAETAAVMRKLVHLQRATEVQEPGLRPWWRS
jgi:hypothetical protein